jgi:nucleotide-binding universal stress UspA family protein
VQIKPILARLQGALGRNDLIQQMVLLPESTKTTRKAKASKTFKLVVGYNGSPNSQTALDLTLWIAYQTRLATPKQVIVHVVYAIDSQALDSQAIDSQVLDPGGTLGNQLLPPNFQSFHSSASPRLLWDCLEQQPISRSGRQLSPPTFSPPTSVLTRPQVEASVRVVDSECVIPGFQAIDAIERADYVLWQARCLAEEWRGSLEAHLRFGSVASELRSVVKAEAADLLLLGCTTANHPLVQQLKPHFPCPILGIPTQHHPEDDDFTAHP